MRSLRLESVSSCEASTIRFGERLAGALRNRAVVALTGPLGAGKTRLAQGLAAGAGYRGRVRSPTFALLHHYRGPRLVRHFDFYRLDSVDEGTAGEWEEAMSADGMTIVEWADRLPDLLPPETIWIALVPAGERTRWIRLQAPLPSPALGDWRLR